ncbi:MAG: four helix bundle protein [Desulfomonilaceae bacterium]
MEVGGLRQGSAGYVFPFEKLDVYQLSLDLADYVLAILERFPANKHMRLISQIEAAVTSPAQNIAEAMVSY